MVQPEINIIKDIIDGLMVELGIIEKTSENSEIVINNFDSDLTYYFTKIFKISRNELINFKGNIPESIKKFIDNMHQSNVFTKINEENNNLKKEVERLKSFETYYNMQMELNKANKS